MILPQLEQNALSDALSSASANFTNIVPLHDPAALVLLQSPLSVYICPADTVPVTNSSRQPRILNRTNNVTTQKQVGSSNYVGVGGSVSFSANTNPKNFNGILVPALARRTRDITDGTSNTLAFGERDFAHMGAIWPATTNRMSFINGGNMHYTLQDGTGGGINTINSNTFASRHPGGANFALCDGSVRFINEGLSSIAGQTIPNPTTNTLGALLAMNDEQAVPGGW